MIKRLLWQREPRAMRESSEPAWNVTLGLSHLGPRELGHLCTRYCRSLVKGCLPREEV